MFDGVADFLHFHPSSFPQVRENPSIRGSTNVLAGVGWSDISLSAHAGRLHTGWATPVASVFLQPSSTIQERRVPSHIHQVHSSPVADVFYLEVANTYPRSQIATQISMNGIVKYPLGFARTCQLHWAVAEPQARSGNVWVTPVLSWSKRGAVLRSLLPSGK